jgi:hypothetical protein
MYYCEIKIHYLGDIIVNIFFLHNLACNLRTIVHLGKKTFYFLWLSTSESINLREIVI